MAKLTLKGMDERMVTLEKRVDNIEKRLSALEKKGTKEEPKNAPKAKPVNIEDYAPKGWKGKKGYTELRKAYSYAVCEETKGVKYDKATYEAASEEYRQKYYDFVANGCK